MRALIVAMLIVLASACAPSPVSSADAQPASAAAAAVSAEKNVINFACQTAADCAVKDVGSCCGYSPACVNINSPTFPEHVSADCADQGVAGVCGFSHVASCACIESRCTSVYADSAGLPLN